MACLFNVRNHPLSFFIKCVLYMYYVVNRAEKIQYFWTSINHNYVSDICLLCIQKPVYESVTRRVTWNVLIFYWEVSGLYTQVNFLLCDLLSGFIRFKYFWRSFINTIITNNWKVLFREQKFRLIWYQRLDALGWKLLTYWQCFFDKLVFFNKFFCCCQFQANLLDNFHMCK